MGKKRKMPVIDEEKENESGGRSTVLHQNRKLPKTNMQLHGPMYTIMSNVQLNETLHKKYIKEMKQLYTKMDHDAFMFTFVKMIKSAMEAEENNEYAANTLQFCATFICSFTTEHTHPVLSGTLNWLLTTISNNPHVRFRLCQFINMILSALGQEAALDDVLCDQILEYMLDRLRDVSISVRYQATVSLQRLQVPDNPDDPVLRAYQFHLCSDPSPRVRMGVITSMGRNFHTLPYILDRLWDIDEKVRRHTYAHMSSFPVRQYKVLQRLILLEQGLNDRSESVRKVVTTILLKQWIGSFRNDLIGLISSLKLDSTEAELDRFRKVAKQTLVEIFKQQSKENLISCLPIEEEGELHRCVPVEKLTIEVALYWQCLAEYFQDTMAEEIDTILPELSVFCDYVKLFCQLQRPDMDKFELMNFQYILLSLMEILCTFDLGDEIGRGNLQKLLAHLVTNFLLDEKIIKVIVKCAENLMPNQAIRMQFFIDIIREICNLDARPNALVHDRTLISELLANSTDADLNLKLSALKVKILELEELEVNYLQEKNYGKAQETAEEKWITTKEYKNLLKPLLDKCVANNTVTLPVLPKTIAPETVLMSLQIVFYMVVSPKIKNLNPSLCKLYNDFISRHLASKQIIIRDWALKVGTAYSLLYESLAKELFKELFSQFYRNHNIRLWETAISCIFELLERYGVANFSSAEVVDPTKVKRNCRILYKTLDSIGSEDEESNDPVGCGDIVYTMSHMLGTCEDACIKSVITKGFCRLILRGRVDSREILEKLLLQYFNPIADPQINQILGVFLEHLIQSKKRNLLESCLVPTILAVISAPYDSPLRDIKPDTIVRFYIDATRVATDNRNVNIIHNKLAITLLNEMLGNVGNKELCKLLSKELTMLDIVVPNDELKVQLQEMTDKLIKSDLDGKTKRYFCTFKDMLDGIYNPQSKNIEENDTDDETKDDETVGSSNKDSTCNDRRTTIESETQEPVSITERLDSGPSVSAGAGADTGATQQVNTTVEKVTEKVSDGEELSPTTRKRTTYGRDNTVGHRSLRKSLNASQPQVPGQEADDGGGGGDGGDSSSSRPVKIRIEARIDSDEKKKQVGDGPTKEPPANFRSRRNLRYPRKGGEGDGNANEKDTTTTDNNASDVQGEQVLPQSKDDATAKSAGRGQSTNSNEKDNKTPRRQNNVEEVSDNETIPPSPRGEQTQYLRTRRQKALLENSIVRQTRSKSRNSTENLNTLGQPAVSATPRRNRKRAFVNSPRTVNVVVDPSSDSPMRKHIRIDNIARSRTSIDLRQNPQLPTSANKLNKNGKNAGLARSKSAEVRKTLAEGPKSARKSAQTDLTKQVVMRTTRKRRSLESNSPASTAVSAQKRRRRHVSASDKTKTTPSNKGTQASKSASCEKSKPKNTAAVVVEADGEDANNEANKVQPQVIARRTRAANGKAAIETNPALPDNRNNPNDKSDANKASSNKSLDTTVSSLTLMRSRKKKKD